MKKRLDDPEALTLIENAEVGNVKKENQSKSLDPWPYVFNLTNCIVGVSVLAMPYCFQQCGILLAVVMIAACSVLTKFTCHFLIMGAFLTRVRSYEELAAKAFGENIRCLIEVVMLGFLMSSIIAFLVVIGDLGPHLVADYLELAAPTERLRILVMVLVMFFVIFPLSTIKEIERFSVISSAAVFFYVIFVVRMILESFSSFASTEWSAHVVWWRPEGFLSCLPIVTMALSCQTQLFHVIEGPKTLTVEQVDSVLALAVNLCSSMYAAVGLFGYVAFFSRTLHGDVLVELHPTLLTQAMKMLFMLSIAISIPLMLFPARHSLFNLFLRRGGEELPMSKIQRSTFHILTAIILLCNLLMAILVPNVEFILGLTGSLIGSLVTIIFPSAIFIAVATKAQHGTAAIAKVCLVVGCFILIMSTMATLNAERKSAMAAKPEPKDIDTMNDAEQAAIATLEKLEERVIDTNINISQKLSDISSLAHAGKEEEAEKLLAEMKAQQEEQAKLLVKQEHIVDQLNKHIQEHRKEQKNIGEAERKDKEDAATKEHLPAAPAPLGSKEIKNEA